MMRRSGGERRPSITPSRYTILVFCGAERTEPDYFDGLKASLREAAVTIKVMRRGRSPHDVVRAAAAYHARKPGVFDEVWCVVDVDDFDIEAAVREAGRLGVNIAVSNPCFELWLLLHHTECRSHCDGCSEVIRRLRKLVPSYDKSQLIGEKT